MGRLRKILGYSWAFLALPIILATFIANDFWAGQLVTGTGLKVSPWLTGGEVLQTVNHEQYRTLIHRAVFEGVFWERGQGFVQINWQSIEGSLPQMIAEEIDYNQDGINDFQIQMNTESNKAVLITSKPYVIGVGQVFQMGKERAVRVLLRNKH